MRQASTLPSSSFRFVESIAPIGSRVRQAGRQAAIKRTTVAEKRTALRKVGENHLTTHHPPTENTECRRRRRRDGGSWVAICSLSFAAQQLDNNSRHRLPPVLFHRRRLYSQFPHLFFIFLCFTWAQSKLHSIYHDCARVCWCCVWRSTDVHSATAMTRARWRATNSTHEHNQSESRRGVACRDFLWVWHDRPFASYPLHFILRRFCIKIIQRRRRRRRHSARRRRREIKRQRRRKRERESNSF